MNVVNDELRDRVTRLNAGLALDLACGDQAVWLARDLLVAGVETPALAEPGSRRRGLWWECGTIPETRELVLLLDTWDWRQDHDAIRELTKDVLRVAEERPA